MAGNDILFFILLEASFENKCEIMADHLVQISGEL
jgi:hypothetical protein